MINARHGRTNTTPGGMLYLDGYEAAHTTWVLDLPGSAAGLSFFMSDLDYSVVETKLEVCSNTFNGGSQLFDLIAGGNSAGANGSTTYVGTDFAGAIITRLAFKVKTAATVGSSTTCRPSRPCRCRRLAGWMLIAGLGALFGFGRRALYA